MKPRGSDRQFWLIPPEAIAIRFGLSHASREVQDLGELLSNTQSTLPVLGNILAKVRLMPHSLSLLECWKDESHGGAGWDCG